MRVSWRTAGDDPEGNGDDHGDDHAHDGELGADGDAGQHALGHGLAVGEGLAEISCQEVSGPVAILDEDVTVEAQLFPDALDLFLGGEIGPVLTAEHHGGGVVAGDDVQEEENDD